MLQFLDQYQSLPFFVYEEIYLLTKERSDIHKCTRSL